MTVSGSDLPSGDVDVKVSAPDMPSADLGASVSVPDVSSVDVPSVDVKAPKKSIFGKLLKKKPSKATVEVSRHQALIYSVDMFLLGGRPAFLFSLFVPDE